MHKIPEIYLTAFTSQHVHLVKRLNDSDIATHGLAILARRGATVRVWAHEVTLQSDQGVPIRTIQERRS